MLGIFTKCIVIQNVHKQDTHFATVTFYTVYTWSKVYLIMCLTKLIKVFMPGDCAKHLER